MTRLLFDTETNGLLNTVTKVHCIGIIDIDTGKQSSFGPNQIDEALDYMYEADELIGHNIIDFDLKMLWKVKRWSPRPGCRRTDTMVVARLIHADIKREDGKRVGFPGKLYGSHSLKAWGLRLGEPKDDFGYDESGKAIPGIWENWTPEMQTYMDQDVRSNHRLLTYLKPWEYPRVPLELEHRVHELALKITEEGWPFDVKAAERLYQKLVERRDVLEKSLTDTFGCWEEVDKIFTPKRDNRTLGYVKGVEVTKMKTVVFNPGSRPHIEKKLREFGWEPKLFTPGGRAKVDESELLKINTPEAKDLIEFLLIQKRLGMLGDGDQAWLKKVDENGLIHGRYNTMGTNTGRAAHFDPNLGQVPSSGSPYGHECRALFVVPDGWRLVGCDLSGAQLRCLAHMVAAFDDGAYASVVLDGDIHWFHVKAIRKLAADLEYDKKNPDHKDSRDKAKTTIYAYLFGAQAPKIGSIWFPAAPKAKQRKWGQQIIDRLSEKVQGLAEIQESIEDELERHGTLRGLDGRNIPIRSAHSALNAVIQNYEAVLCKTWITTAYDRLLAAGLKWGWKGDFVFVGWIHDELQTACRPEHVDLVKKIVTQAARDAGIPYGFRVRLDSEASVGLNWKETH